MSVHFNRESAFLKIGNSTVLAIVSNPEEKVPVSNDYQIGFVELPAAGGATHLEVIQRWISEFDTDHTCNPLVRFFSKSGNGKAKRLPKRLLNVGVAGELEVHLVETGPEDTGEWIALSHIWGVNCYCNTHENLQQHLEGLAFDKLPATFRDAATVTRAMGHRYLWIDSLCVIQGPYGDFQDAAERMEDIFYNAYCVIAATCATDHFSGFLKPRRARDYIGLSRDGQNRPPIYICELIDDFKTHVLEGDLSRRGWVLQDHALARRTIFFTEHQTYFECGQGIRCETSTKMSK